MRIGAAWYQLFRSGVKPKNIVRIFSPRRTKMQQGKEKNDTHQ